MDNGFKVVQTTNVKEMDMFKRTEDVTIPKKAASDAIELLKQDHRKVEQLFDDYFEREDDSERERAETIFKELSVHGEIEEEIFYSDIQQENAFREVHTEEKDKPAHEEVGGSMKDETNEAILSAYKDHQAMKDVIERLRRLDACSSEFRHGMMELQELVTEHVSLEEEVLFSQVLNLKLDTKALGAQIRRRKQDLSSEAA